MTYSMTGFGSASGSCLDYAIEAQVKTLNYRGLDIHINAGEFTDGIEMLFTSLIKQYIGRGRVDVTVTLKRTGKKAAGLNETLLESRTNAVMGIMKGEWSRERCLGFVLGQNDVWKATDDEKPSQEVIEEMLEVTRKALDLVVSTRKREGKALQAYFLNAIDELESSRQGAMARAPERINEFRQRMNERLLALQEEYGTALDQNLLASEVAMLADKIDVAEELTRIAAHLSALRILFLSPDDPLTCQGKKIDFYLQELGRESTTIASKSRDTILTRHTIDLRTQIESMREQAANIQ